MSGKKLAKQVKCFIYLFILFLFAVLIETGYHSNNPYHNALHAADVTQAMHCYLQEKQVSLKSSQNAMQYVTALHRIKCDVIKQKEEKLANIDLKIEPIKRKTVLCFQLFCKTFNSLYLWN